MDSTDDANEQFWQLVDHVIESANEKSQNLDSGIVCSALMQAASRYSAFYLAVSSESRKDLIADKDEVLSQYVSEFKNLLAGDLDDYIENYKVYLKSDPAD